MSQTATPSQNRGQAPVPDLPALGVYLGTPVIAVARDDGWLTCLWPDSEQPRKGTPTTYRNGKRWRVLDSQVELTVVLPLDKLRPVAMA
jgi:hypothetical protein